MLRTVSASDATSQPAQPVGSARWLLSLALMVSVVIAFLDRNNITFALTDIAADMGWSEAETASNGGVLMSAFYVAYGVSNVGLSGWVEQRFGVRRTLLGMVVLVSLVTALSTTAGTALGAFIAFRLVLGLCEGVHFPMMGLVSRRFYPPSERARGNAVFGSGILISVLVAPVVLIPLQEAFGWRAMFIVIAGLGALVTLPLLALFVWDRPQEHPRISAAEEAWIATDRTEEPSATMRYRELFSNTPMRLVLLTGVLANISALGLLSWLPTWLEKSRSFDADETKTALFLASFCSVVGMLAFAWLGDRFQRRIHITVGAFCAAAGLILMLALIPSRIVVVPLLCAAMTMFGAWAASEWAVVQRVLPDSSMARMGGLYNGVATLVGGGLGPSVLGGVVAQTGNYDHGVATLAVVLIAAAASYAALGRHVRC